jgi:flagellar protein FlaG
METGNIAKPAVAVAPLSPPRVDHLASAGAVKTELVPEAAVQQAAKTQAVRFEQSESVAARAALEAALQDRIERDLSIDQKSREVIFQAIDKESREVVRQIPDETMLRLRTYLRAVREAEQDVSDVRRVEKIA